MSEADEKRAHSASEAEGSPPGSRPGRGSMRRRWWAAAVVMAVALAAVWAVRSRSSGHGAAPQGASAQARPVPVAAATVSRRDVPIYLEGLGNATAFKTVTVKTQVDGRLDQVLFQEGQAVRKGQVLAQIDPRPFQVQLAQAQGALARDEAQLRNARLNVERDRQLVAQKLIAQQQLDTDVAAAGQLEGTVEIDRAAIASAKLNLDYSRITSPLDGVTGIRQIDPGNVVHPTDQNGIVVLTQLDPIAVIFTLPQDELTAVASELANGQLHVDLYGRDRSTLLGEGRLELVDNQINQATSTIRLKAIAPNPKRLLWPNQFVNVRLRLTTRRDALVMPTTAVQRGPSGTFVYVITNDMTAAPRPVEVQLMQGDVAVVGSGVQDGERVVTDGQNQLRPGIKVAPRDVDKGAGQAAMAADGSDVGQAGRRAGGGDPGGEGRAR